MARVGSICASAMALSISWWLYSVWTVAWNTSYCIIFYFTGLDTGNMLFFHYYHKERHKLQSHMLRRKKKKKSEQKENIHPSHVQEYDWNERTPHLITLSSRNRKKEKTWQLDIVVVVSSNFFFFGFSVLFAFFRRRPQGSPSRSRPSRRAW